jgi:transcriptional regulator with XRE-family HTH domain
VLYKCHDGGYFERMSASKNVHTLAILREKLGIKQSDLARMGGVALSSIQSIEANRLGLSKQLAARICVATGADLEWILANDVAVPMPPLTPRLPYRVGDGEGVEQQDYAATVDVLIDGFCRLFAAARRLSPSSRRGALQLIIAQELDRLRKSEKADPEAQPFFTAPKELFEYFKSRTDSVDADLIAMLNLDQLISNANTQAEKDFVESMMLKPAPYSPSELKKMKTIAAKSQKRQKDQLRTRVSA